MTIPLLDVTQLIDNIKPKQIPLVGEYFAFYSSWFGGIVTEPALMLLPMDDHMVHRGDGVFETMHAIHQSVYLIDAHLERLFRSADKISLQPPFTLDQLKNIITETLRVAAQKEAMVRLFLSRGPGQFSVNPYDALQAQCYVVATKMKKLPQEKYKLGVTIGKSHIPAKPAWMAQIKSCNYLPNVLMKKEAVDRQLDFVISIDEKGYLAESATENIMIIDQANRLIYPQLDNILQGTTMMRICELAHQQGLVVLSKPVTLDELLHANEVILTGTSLNVLPVVQFEKHRIGQGKPGPLAKQLNTWLLQDIQTIA